jgi:hypothetical protein
MPDGLVGRRLDELPPPLIGPVHYADAVDRTGDQPLRANEPAVSLAPGPTSRG